MAKSKKRRTNTSRGRRPSTLSSVQRRDNPPSADRESDLLAGVDQAMGEDHPLTMLALVSTLLAVMDPRTRDPFDDGRDSKASVSREELLGSFLEVEAPQTTALLAVIACLVDDELLAARIGRALASRHDPLPGWLHQLGATTVYRTVEMVDPLGDGDDIMIGARLPTDEELTAVVYIDHNLGTLVKDAFVVPESIDAVIALMRTHAEDPDVTFSDLEPADARARILEAIDLGAMEYLPRETDTWPASRALIEWLARLLPSGGIGYQRPEWDDRARASLTEEFFRSSFASGLDDEDYRGLFETLLWFGCDYGPGDPLRWSPVAVEILLADWLPRKVIADSAYLAKAPALLRACIRFSHHARGIRASLTGATLQAVDAWEPDYQRTIRSPRPQGPASMLAAAGLLDPQDDDVHEDGGYDAVVGELYDVMLASLRRAVGGEEALKRLDDRRLPDEPFDWDTVPADVLEPVTAVLALCDKCCEELLDIEYRTACRRLLGRCTAGDAAVFRRGSRPETTAAAICWIIGKANDLFSPAGGGMLVKDLTAHFGLRSGGVSQRAVALLKAGGFISDLFGGMDLGSSDYLVATRRHRVIELRDHYRALADSDK